MDAEKWEIACWVFAEKDQERWWGEMRDLHKYYEVGGSFDLQGW